MSNLNLICVPGTVSGFSNADGLLQFGLQHITERTNGEPNVSDFSVICKNTQMAKWIDTNGPLNEGDTVMVFATRFKEFRDESGPWLCLYSDSFVVLDPESPMPVVGLISGNIGQEPEMSYTNNGTPKTRASIALEWSERNATDTGWLKETTWCAADFWGQAGDGKEGQAGRAAEVLAKGEKVQATVRNLHTRTYTAKDGTVRLSVDVTGGIFRMVNPAKQQQTAQTSPAGVRRPGAAPAVAAPQSVVAIAMAAAANGVVSNMAASDVPF